MTTRHPGATMDEHVVAVINEVLAGERGSVAALVQLSAMATDALERQALTVTGGQAVQACLDLRDVLERHGAPVSEEIGDASARLLELERLDERYLAFGQLRRQLMGRIESIAASDLDASSQAALAMVHTIQSVQAAWALQRAGDFAKSREDALAADGRPPESREQSTDVDVSGDSLAADGVAANAAPADASEGETLRLAAETSDTDAASASFETASGAAPTTERPRGAPIGGVDGRADADDTGS